MVALVRGSFSFWSNQTCNTEVYSISAGGIIAFQSGMLSVVWRTSPQTYGSRGCMLGLLVTVFDLSVSVLFYRAVRWEF